MIVQVPIFIVNLKRDKEKKEHMEELCVKHSLKCEFIEAVYGRDLQANEVDKVYNSKASIKEINRELTRGELGCALSHLSIYKKMIDNEIENAIVFEDDIYLDDDFSIVVDSIQSFPENWELILLGYYSNVTTESETVSSYRYKKQITKRHQTVRLVQQAYGTHGYIINLKGAKKLINQMKTINKPIDHYTGDDSSLNVYAVRPRIVRLAEIFKDKSSITQEREQLQSKNIILSHDSLIKIVLKRFGLYTLLLKLRLTYNRIKTLRKYEDS